MLYLKNKIINIMIESIEKLLQIILRLIAAHKQKYYIQLQLKKYGIKIGTELIFYNDPAYGRYNERCEGFVHYYDEYYNSYIIKYYNVEIDPDRRKQKSCLLFEIKKEQLTIVK